MNSILAQALIYLLAAVICVPIAKRLGLGSVLGYLIAGVIIGPILGLVGSEAGDIQQFAEFGVVMMLFLVGLELEPERLWAMRGRLLGLGGLQLLLTSTAITAGAYFIGNVWSMSIAMGLILALSSTAIVLQTLSEKGLNNTEGGQAAFSVLLFQDIAVIPILALLPLLAMPELAGEVGHGDGGGGHGGATLISGLNPLLRALATFGAVASIVIVGHYLTRPIFRFISETGLREMFTAAALLFVIGIAVLMSSVGLSPALGTFLAGVVLANSEFRHELESDIEPFKGLLLGLFFITVGCGINLSLLASDWQEILSLTLAVMAIKALVLFFIGALFKLPARANALFTLSLAQAGEFGFVLTSFSLQNSIVGKEEGELLSMIIALSMIFTPLLFLVYDRVILKMAASESQREPDAIATKGTAIIAGHGRFGQAVNRMLRMNGFDTVILDHDYKQVERLRTFGIPTYYGDASRPELLESAGLRDAQVLVLAMDNSERVKDVALFARQINPNIHIVARAESRLDVYELFQAGCEDIVREVFDSSVRAGRSTLEALGYHPYKAERAARAYVDWDRMLMIEQAELYDPNISIFENKPFIEKAKQILAEVDAASTGNTGIIDEELDRAWRPRPPSGSAAAPSDVIKELKLDNSKN